MTIDFSTPDEHLEQAKLRLMCSKESIPQRSPVRDACLGDSEALIAIGGFLQEIRGLLANVAAPKIIEFNLDEPPS